jgi:hypothetical protein
MIDHEDHDDDVKKTVEMHEDLWKLDI